MFWAQGLIQLPVRWRRLFHSRGAEGKRQEEEEEGLDSRDGTGALPTWGTSSEVTTGKATSGKRFFPCTDAPLFSFVFSQCYLVLLKQAINSVTWVFSVLDFFIFFLTSI